MEEEEPMRAITTAILVTGLTVAPAGAWPWQRKVHRYKIVTGDGNESVLYGEKIRVKGFCVELVLNRRVDTIVCGPRYVTELLEGTPETEPAPEPTKLPKDTTVAGRR